MMIPCIIYWCFDKKTGVFAMFCFGTGNFVNQFIKNTACVYRPWINEPALKPAVDALDGATGYSFPSGHTVSAATVAGAIGWAWRKKWPAVFVFCILYILAVGFSRNYLGVHTPQDVLVALLESIVIIAAIGPFVKWVDGAPNRDILVVAVGLAISAAFLVYATYKPYPMDYVNGELLVNPRDMLIDCYRSAGMLAGMLVGWFCERRYVGFETDNCTAAVRVVRAVIGVVLSLSMYAVVGSFTVNVLGSLQGGLIKMFITLLTAAFLAPGISQAIEKNFLAKR